MFAVFAVCIDDFIEFAQTHSYAEKNWVCGLWQCYFMHL